MLVELGELVPLLAEPVDVVAVLLLPARSNCIRIVKYDVSAPTICVIWRDYIENITKHIQEHLLHTPEFCPLETFHKR